MHISEKSCPPGGAKGCTSRALPTCNGHNKGFGTAIDSSINHALHPLRELVQSATIHYAAADF